jgi:E3 ubiquitin-protein ligase TRIP12
MPTLLNVLSSNDQKVVEQGCLCVSRVVESFKHKPDKLEELIEPAMLRAILRLLLPGTTNLIGPHIHTQFLRVLAIVARASPRLSVELLGMDVVDTLYQILTGVSPPRDVDNKVAKIDNVVIMQALVHRPREQVFETLNVICELLPAIPGPHPIQLDNRLGVGSSDFFSPHKASKAKEAAEKRCRFLADCKPELKRFAMIMLPTLTDAYSSTVNLGVRQRVLTAQLKMLQYLDSAIIEDALRSVPYASFLAAILSQKDQPCLVLLALQCAELLFGRLETIYQYQFHREGVISEIIKLAELPLSTAKRLEPPTANTDDGFAQLGQSMRLTDSRASSEVVRDKRDTSPDDDDDRDDDDGRDGADDGDDQDDDNDDENDDVSDTETSSSFSGRPLSQTLGACLYDNAVGSARAFLQVYERTNGSRAMRDKASEILTELRSLAAEIESCYLGGGGSDGVRLFEKLASYFDGDALESITSSELLNSGIINVLLEVFGNSHGIAFHPLPPHSPLVPRVGLGVNVDDC